MTIVEVQRQVNAGVQAVTALLDDMDGWSSWMGIDEVTVREAQPQRPLPVGTRYDVRTGRIRDCYEVVEADLPRRSRYRLVQGTLPVRDYEGELSLSPTDGGTQVSWRVQFSPRIPFTGWVLQRLARRALSRALQGLADQVAAGTA